MDLFTASKTRKWLMWKHNAKRIAKLPNPLKIAAFTINTILNYLAQLITTALKMQFASNI